jgi:protein-S-isoprenylcysteine O-methyltransferase Ste14
VALILLGTYLYAAGLIAFRSFARMSGMDASELVRTGVYRWSRNPQNLGWALFLGGIAVVSRSGAATLMAVLFWVMFRIYVPLEEEFLSRVFGTGYKSYCAHTARYLGLPTKQRSTDP